MGYGKHSNRSQEKSKRKQFKRSSPFFAQNSGVRHYPQGQRCPLQSAQGIKTQSKKQCPQEARSQKRDRTAKKTRQNGDEVEKAMRFEELKNDILGKDYSLSIAFVSEKKSREINKKYRNKDKPTNVLSFALRPNEGELVLCKAVIKRETKIFGKNFDQLLRFLVIHGMLHLKGMKHGERMEKFEKVYCEKFRI